MHRMTRRQALYAAGAAMFGAARTSAQTPSLDLAGVDHIEFYVSQPERTRDFFAAVFGNTVLRNSSAAKRYVKIGAAYVAFERPRTAGGPLVTDHVSVAIRNLDMPRLHDLLDARGIAYRDYPSGRDTAIVDADGLRTQLSPENGWSLLAPPTFVPDAVAGRDEPVFRPMAIEHVLLNVADPDTSARFYEKVLGPVSLRETNRVWFRVGRSRLGLLNTADTQRPGMHHFCVSAAPYDYGVAVARLAALGATIEPPEQPGAALFRDPDGMLIEVNAVD